HPSDARTSYLRTLSKIPTQPSAAEPFYRLPTKPRQRADQYTALHTTVNTLNQKISTFCSAGTA
ncbi:hypothetical protein, partial [Solilutibacter pythonis]|uniref:hypothetical protein n=1 Tax=Solilutibacter pythonis TaxID=2483112 RepID=UPI001B8672BE